MASKRPKMPPKTPFCAIFTVRGMSLVGAPCSFQGFVDSYTTKCVQKVTHLKPKQLSKTPCVARKCRQSAFLVTKMASLSPILFFNCRGWAGGFPAWISASACLWSVAVSWEKTVDGEVHSVAVVYQTMYSNWRVR